MAQTAMNEEEAAGAAKTKYLAFTIGTVGYALEVGVVTEIIGLQHITPVPNVPKFVKGVINLRGKVIPVMDVRLRFLLEEKPYEDRTCIIVVQIEGTAIGLVVDAVSEVFDLPEEKIEEAPSLGQTIEGKCISGLGKVGTEVKLILDAKKLLSDSETFGETPVDPARAD